MVPSFMRIMHIICGPGAGGAEVFVKDMSVYRRPRSLVAKKSSGFDF